MTTWTDHDLEERLLAGDMRAVARMITLIENGVPRAREIHAKLYSRTGRTHVVGVTGSPGAGKSTLVDRLAADAAAAGKRVAVLAVDPSSPFSGGALLGDRVRMVRSTEQEKIYVRSMATRGALGGISASTRTAIDILDVSGFDLVILETVGVGQAEVDVVSVADTCIVVLVPGMGDGVQAIKAGILEIADLFVINKADRDGSDIVAADLRMLMGLVEYSPDQWSPPVIKTVATTGAGLTELAAEIARHKQWSATSPEALVRRSRVVEQQIRQIISELVDARVSATAEKMLTSLVDDCLAKRRDPRAAAELLLSALECAPK